MSNNKMTIIILLTTAWCLLASIFAFSADQSKTQGMIISRGGETLVVRGPSGNTTVLLTDSTETVDYRGLFGLGKKQMGSTVLIPGLKVTVFGTAGEGGQVVASKIVVDGDDLETAEMIQSGLHPTAEQVEANVKALESHRQQIGEHETQLAAQKEMIDTHAQDIASNKQQIEQNIKDIQETTDRFEQLSDYDVKAQATLKFAIGSTKISPADEEQLKQLAQTASSLKGYLIEVTGYADSTGSAAMNTKLSEARARQAITYLVQQGNIPVRHIVAPGAMGEYGATASNETKAGRAENRRVEVKVLVNKGIAGS